MDRGGKEHQRAFGSYPCLCGPLEVNRCTYRLVGLRNGPAIVPMELDAGLIEGATPALARDVAHGYGENNMRAHLVLLEKAYRLPPPRTTLERLAKPLAANVTNKTPHIESKILRLERATEDAFAIVIGVDRTSAPMEELSEIDRQKQETIPTSACPQHQLKSTTEWPTPQR